MQIGQEMGALSWHLRAAMSLVRLRMRLREVYGHFTEGFKFPDLQGAAALISQAR